MDNITKRLRNKVEFIIIENTTDEEGYPIKKEQLIKKCHASVRGLRGREFYNAAQVQAENNKVFNCRYFKGLESNMFIRYNEKLYNIKSINDLGEKHIEYEIHASVVSSSG